MDGDRRRDSGTRDRIGEIRESMEHAVRGVDEKVQGLPEWQQAQLAWQKEVYARVRLALVAVGVMGAIGLVGAVVVVTANRSLQAQSSRQAVRQSQVAQDLASAARELSLSIQRQRLASLLLNCTEDRERNLRARATLDDKPALAREVGLPLIDALAPNRSETECDQYAQDRAPSLTQGLPPVAPSTTPFGFRDPSPSGSP